MSPAILQNYGDFCYLRFLIPPAIPILYWIVFFTYNTFLEEGLIVTMFVCWFWCVLGIFIIISTGYFFKSYNLKIDRDDFRFKCNFLGLIKTCRGKAKNLRWGKTQQTPIFDSFEYKLNCCSIYIKGKKYLFGSWLTPIEQEWITAEIAEFISEINDRD